MKGVNQYQSCVNQQFDFIYQHLQLIDSSNDSPLDKSDVKGLEQSVLAHLYLAQRYYLQELAEQQHLPQAGTMEKLPQLVQAMVANDCWDLVVEELQAAPWWQAIAIAWEQQLFPQLQDLAQSPCLGQKPLPPKNELALADISQETTAVDARQLTYWYDRLKELVHRHRQLAIEE